MSCRALSSSCVLQRCFCASCQDQLLRVKQKLSSDQLAEESRQQALTAEIQQVRQKTQELRSQLSQKQKRTGTQLCRVSVRSNQAAKELQAAVAKVRRRRPVLRLRVSHVCALTQGQKLLRVAKLCHQLEVKSGVNWFSLEAEAPQTVRVLGSRGSKALTQRFDLHGNGEALTIAVCPPGVKRLPGAAAATEETQRRHAAARSSKAAEGAAPAGKPAAEGSAAPAPGRKRHRSPAAVPGNRRPRQTARCHTPPPPREDGGARPLPPGDRPTA